MSVTGFEPEPIRPDGVTLTLTGEVGAERCLFFLQQGSTSYGIFSRFLKEGEMAEEAAVHHLERVLGNETVNRMGITPFYLPFVDLSTHQGKGWGHYTCSLSEAGVEAFKEACEGYVPSIYAVQLVYWPVHALRGIESILFPREYEAQAVRTLLSQ